jgi:hypothetical protein
MAIASLDLIQNTTVRGLLKSHPGNPYLRGIVAQVLGIVVPEDCQDVSAYVLANYSLPPVPPQKIKLRASRSVTESGYTNWTQTGTESARLEWTEAALRELIAEHNGDWGDIQRAIEDDFQERASFNGNGDSDRQDGDDEYQETETGDMELEEGSVDTLKELISQWEEESNNGEDSENE